MLKVLSVAVVISLILISSVSGKSKFDNGIGSVERGEQNISIVNIGKVAKALGVEISQLVK